MERRSFIASSFAAALLPRDVAWLEPRSLEAPAIIRLSSNENPLGVPDSAKRAIIESLIDGNRYPRQNRDAAHAKVASKLGVQNQNIMLGNGSSEILQMVVQAITVQQPRARVVIPDPTFEDVEQTATTMGAEVVKVPLRPDFSHDLEAMKRAVGGSTGPTLIFICNPNNPTGTLTSCDAVGQWISSAPANVWFLVDEAYFEFVTDKSYRTFIPEAIARPNLIVSRTFSKIYGLAGVRFGYGVGHPDTIRQVNAFRAGTNLNHLALAAAPVCLDDDAFMRKSLQVNAEGRDFVYRTLDKLKLEYLPTHANFVMHRINGELGTYIAKMLENSVRVGRAFPPMLNYNRVSLGLPEELSKWAEVLTKLRANGLA